MFGNTGKGTAVGDEMTGSSLGLTTIEAGVSESADCGVLCATRSDVSRPFCLGDAALSVAGSPADTGSFSGTPLASDCPKLSKSASVINAIRRSNSASMIASASASGSSIFSLIALLTASSA